jgi:hydrogenase maturation protein HypF
MLADLMRKQYKISGIVQGVGFRPFIYSLAKRFEIKGYIKNNKDGVYIEAEGSQLQLDSFSKAIQNEIPQIAYINEFHVEDIEVIGDKDFLILKSEDTDSHNVFISPDVAICKDCEDELNNIDDKRYKYSFINCTNCGPRFTITKTVPYDRKYTTMDSFEMCPECKLEYENPIDRRFHAQPISCPNCGPRYFVVDREGNEIKTINPIEYTKEKIKEGNIVGIKGIGGFHLVCDAKNEILVKELRARKKRDKKPFALMVSSIETAKEFCEISEKEAEILQGIRKPIVLVSKKENNILPAEISQDNDRLGIMLPYTPMHLLLFDENIDALVMTSGNISGEPIYYQNEKAVVGLSEIADFYLINDRDIYIRTDDSVTSVFNNKEYIIRRSRGYVPMPLNLPTKDKVNNGNQNENVILACGAELKNTFALTKKNMAFLGHYIGDLENYETLISFEDGIEHFKDILMIKPDIVVCDMHKEYLSTKYAVDLCEKNSNIKLVQVQHHKAHIASCMAENEIKEKVIGIAFDGSGYGEDGTIWGGEFFVGDYENFDRKAHLQYIGLPGGEKAIKEPWRMAYSYLLELYTLEEIREKFHFIKSVNEENLGIIEAQIKNKINCPLTSSAGRLFDAVAAILNICTKIEYEGQAAILLEKQVLHHLDDSYCIDDMIEYTNGNMIINTVKLIKNISDDYLGKIDSKIIATKFHNTLAELMLQVCENIRSEIGINKVVVSGGVFQNFTLLDKIIKKYDNQNFKLYTHSRVPTNDGGIAYGQVAIVKWKELV